MSPSARVKGHVYLTVDRGAHEPPLVDVRALQGYLRCRGFYIGGRPRAGMPVYWMIITRNTTITNVDVRRRVRARGYRAVAILCIHTPQHPRMRVYPEGDVLVTELAGDRVDLTRGGKGRGCVRHLLEHFQTSTPVPSVLVVDNSRDLSVAKMTPRLIRYVRRETPLNCIVVSTRHSLQRAFERCRIIGVILSGGPLLLSEKTDLRMYNQNITALLVAERRALPVLGICFGMQIMAASYGGDVQKMYRRVQGAETVRVVDKSRLFGHRVNMRVFSSHLNYVHRPPYGFKVTAVDDDGHIQAIEHDTRNLYGVQFHPEGTLEGCRLLRVFICVCVKHNKRPLCESGFPY